MSPPQLDERLDVFLAAMLAGQAFGNLLRREFEASEVPYTAWGLLVHVEASGTATPSQLAAETGVTATTIRDQVHSLVDRGALRRVPNPDDNRSYLLELTATGKANLKRGRAAAKRAESALAAQLGRPVPSVLAELLELRDAARAAGG